MDFNKKVYKLVKKIPKGRVSTYGEIAGMLGNPKLARQVGWALHANTSSGVPCHRVVNREGRVAPNFAFDGAKEQIRRLEAEGVEFKGEMYVDITKHIWQG